MLQWFNNFNDFISVESQTSWNSPAMMAFRKQSSCSNDSGSGKHWDFRRKQSPLSAQRFAPEHEIAWENSHVPCCPGTPPDQESQGALHGSLLELWLVLFTQASAQWHLVQELLKGTDPQSFPRDTGSTAPQGVCSPKKCPVATDVPCSNPRPLETPSHG